jgi:hypothetical protein
MAANFLSSTNGFVPGFNGQMTERLIVDYGRNYKDCPVTGLADIITSDLPAGYFARIEPDQQALLIDSPNAFKWPDNTPAPVQEDNRRQHEMIPWAAERYTYQAYVGNLEKQFTAWDVEAQVLNDLGNKAMLNRAKLFYTLVSTAGTYTNAGGTGVDHTGTATALGGGLWSAGTSANRYIQKTLAAVVQAMEKATVNGLNLDDLWLVVSPTVADGMSRSQEIADGYHRQEQFADYMKYDLFTDQFARYGLPPKLYGINLLVDRWIERTTKIGATATKSFVSGSNAAYVLHRPGGIKSASGGRAHGSVAFFTVKGQELNTEVIDMPWDKRQKVMVTDMLDCKMVAPAASYLITATLS